jgi:hypothetical protein
MTGENSIQPHLRVEAGQPTAEELAIVVALLQAAQAAAAATASNLITEPKSTWNRNAAILRSAITPGHNQWQSSFRRGLN